MKLLNPFNLPWRSGLCSRASEAKSKILLFAYSILSDFYRSFLL